MRLQWCHSCVALVLQWYSNGVRIVALSTPSAAPPALAVRKCRLSIHKHTNTNGNGNGVSSFATVGVACQEGCALCVFMDFHFSFSCTTRSCWQHVFARARVCVCVCVYVCVRVCVCVCVCVFLCGESRSSRHKHNITNGCIHGSCVGHSWQ
jgi:hypothetical protein